MKTKAEVKEYIRNADWYYKFIINFVQFKMQSEEYKNLGTDLKEYLEGEATLDTIKSAFLCFETPEGSEFWKNEAEKFSKWFIE